jgi:hypothetical protein
MSHRKNVALLAAAQALLLTNGIMLVSINGLLGLQLAADKRLAPCRSPPMSSAARWRHCPPPSS